MNKIKVGLQLYSVRDDMQKDMEATLKKVSEIGYDYVEFAGYFGKSAAEIRQILDKNNLKCISVHQNHSVYLNNAEKEIDFIEEIGAKFSAIPWMGPENQAGTPLFKKTTEEIIKVGKLLKQRNIQLLYHNHDFEFNKFEGQYKLDILYNTVPKKYLMTEIDTCWAKYAGCNPSEYILKYKGRCPIVHLKDYVCNNDKKDPVYALIDEKGEEIKKNNCETDGFEFKVLGDGIQDFKSILEASEKAGTEYVIVEQDNSPKLPPLESAKRSRDYLKTLGL